MQIRKYMIGLAVMIILVSTVIPVFSCRGEDNSESSSVAPYEEFFGPDDKTQSEGRYKFSYTYMMEYDVVPENLIMFLNGTCSGNSWMVMDVNRPDDKGITLVKRENIEDHIDISHPLKQSAESRESIHDFGANVMAEEGVERSDIPKEADLSNPTKVLFGEANEDILTDPDPLKGEYEFEVKIYGDNIEMNFGEEETNLRILSEPPSEPRNLEGEYKDGEVELRWDEPEKKRGSEIMQYDIYRATTTYNYEYIGNVSADSTEYVDDLEGKSDRRKARKGDILYYKVIAIPKGDYHYLMGKEDEYKRSSDTRREEIVHLSHEETEKSDMSYKWVMDYSSLSEDYFEERVNMDSVNIDKMDGGDVFFYDLTRSNEENGEIVYEYEGGFISQGKADMNLKNGENLSSAFNISVDKSQCDFSGKIWAEEISDPVSEGLKIVKQTIHSEGKVSATMNNTFDINFKENQDHLESSKELDIKWTADVELNYEENNGWIVPEEEFGAFGGPFNYFGNLEAKAELRRQSNKLDAPQSKEGQVSKEISGESMAYSSSFASGLRLTFTPIVGASNLGYYSALYQTIDTSLLSLESITADQYLTFSTACQRDEFSREKLYRNQYMDPMALPGMGSFMGIEFKRANFARVDSLEGIINDKIRAKKRALEEEPPEGWSEWEEKEREKLKEDLMETISHESPWAIHQFNGFYRVSRYSGAQITEPLGYFASEPLSEDEIESYNADMEQFFENQMAGGDSTEEEDNGGGLLPGYTSAVLLVSIFLSVVIYGRRRNKKQT